MNYDWPIIIIHDFIQLRLCELRSIELRKLKRTANFLKEGTMPNKKLETNVFITKSFQTEI